MAKSRVRYTDIYMITSSPLSSQGVDGNYEGNNGLPGVSGPPGPQVHNHLYVRTPISLLQQIFWLRFSCILSSRVHLVLQDFLWVQQSLYSFVFIRKHTYIDYCHSNKSAVFILFYFDFQGKPGLPGTHGAKGSEGPRGPPGIPGLDGFPGQSVRRQMNSGICCFNILLKMWILPSLWHVKHIPVLYVTLKNCLCSFFRVKREREERKERRWVICKTHYFTCFF